MSYTQRRERGHRNQFQQSDGILETEMSWEPAPLGLNQSAQVRRKGKSFREVVACEVCGKGLFLRLCAGTSVTAVNKMQ